MDIYKLICFLHLLILCGGPLLTDAQPPWRGVGYGRRRRGRFERRPGIFHPSYPISGGLYSETGGLYPETGGLYPETGGLYPETGRLYPATGGIYPETGGLYPGVDPGLYPDGVPGGPVLHPAKVGRPIVQGAVPAHQIPVVPVAIVPIHGPTAVEDTSHNSNMNVNVSNNNKNVHDQAGSHNVRVSQGRDRNRCQQECGMHGACMLPSMCLPNPDCSTGYGCQ